MAIRSKKPTTRTTRKPTVKFSQEMFDTMMTEIMEGATIRDICSGDARPSINVFYYWLTKNPALCEQYKYARDTATDTFEADILAMASATGPDNAAANKARFEMLRWIMARRAPKRYGEKQQLEHSGPGGRSLPSTPTLIIQPVEGKD